MNLPSCHECRCLRGAGTCAGCIEFRAWMRREGLLDANTREHPEIQRIQLLAAGDELALDKYLKEASGDDENYR